MKKTFRTGLQIVLLLTILLFNLGVDHQTAYAAAPSHDNFANAKLIDSVTYSDLNVDITDATTQFINPPFGADPDNVGPCENGIYLNRGLKTVWYKYTNTTGAEATFAVDTNDSTYDTYIAVWTGNETNLNLVGCNDENFLGFSEMIFIAKPGVTYYIEVAKFNGYYGDPANPDTGGTLQFHTYSPKNTEVYIGTSLMGTYYVPSGTEQRLYYNTSSGPVKVGSLTNTDIVAAIRLQSYANNTLYSFVETMGVPLSLLSHKYYFPTYNNTWTPLNSQVRFGNLETTTTRIRVTIGSTIVWEDNVPGLEEKRLTFPVSGGPVVVESLDTAKKIVAAIRLQSYANNTLYSFSETMGIPDQALSHVYYFPTYNNTWTPLNSQIRFGNLDATPTTIRVTIGGQQVWQEQVPGRAERRLYFPVSGGPVVVESLDPNKKIVAAIRLQSYADNTLYSFVETMGVPGSLLSHKYIFPTYNNTWTPLNSQVRFGNLDATPTTIRVTIGGTVVWEQEVPGLEERRLYFAVSGGPVIIESLDPAKKIAAAIRLQSYANNKLYSFAETVGIPSEYMSDTIFFPTYNNTWPPLNSQLRFGVP